VFLPIWAGEEALQMRPHGTKIAIVSDHASPLAAPGRTDAGGQNVYVAHVAREFAVRGYDVDVFTRRDDPRAPASQPLGNGVTVRNVSAGPPAPVSKDDLLPHMSRFTDEVEAACLAGGHDVLHANFWMSGLVAATVKRRLGIPFIVTFHALGKIRRREQGAADGSPDLRIPIEEHIVREADRVVAECPEEVRDLIELYGADLRRVSLVPAGFDPAAFAPIDRDEARRIVGLPADAFVVTHVGRLVRRKGIAELLEGFARFRAAFPGDARLVIVGGDDADPGSRDEHDRLARIAMGLRVGDAVRFEGAVDRAALRPYYGAADVFATTPWYEPFGITPLESMACGTPVLGTRVGGIAYTVVDGRTGWLVPPRDATAIAERLAWFAAERDGLTPLRVAAVQRARHFRWTDVGAALDAIVGDVVRAPVLEAEAVS
jgi:glycosyltransferase involved in cell wall biosynthesis